MYTLVFMIKNIKSIGVAVFEGNYDPYNCSVFQTLAYVQPEIGF